MRTFSLHCIAARLAGLVLLGLLLCFPKQSIDGALAGLACCEDRLIPALFPFLVASALVISSPWAGYFGLVLLPYTHLVLGIRDRKAAAVLMTGWLGGFAVAARGISALYAEGRVTRREASLLLVCGVGAGPAFVVNTVGLGLLGSVSLGVCLFASLLAANLCCGLIFRLLLPPDGTCLTPETEGFLPDPSLVSAMQQSIPALLTVCGFAVLFSSVLACLDELLSFCPGLSFPAHALLEVTSGCLAAAGLSQHAAAACCTVLSLQSLSVLLQVRALLHPGLSLGPLLAVRPVHLLLSLFWLRLSVRVLPGAEAVLCSFSSRVILSRRLTPDAALALFGLCCAVLSFTSRRQWDIINRNDNHRSSSRGK